MQRDEESHAAGEVEQQDKRDERDELAERRRRSPRQPRFKADVEAARSIDLRRRPPAAATLGAKHAELVERLAASVVANPRPMWSMFVAARWLAECFADDDEANKPHVALLKALAAARVPFQEIADHHEEGGATLREFDEAAAKLNEICSEMFDVPVATPLSREQHLLLIAAGFAQNDMIAAYLEIEPDALRTRMRRLRDVVPDFDAEAARLMPQVVEHALRLTDIGFGAVDVDKMRDEAFKRAGLDWEPIRIDDPRVDAAYNDYYDALIDLMLARIALLATGA